MLEFRFTLALALGMTVHDMMSKMSALEETFWLARYKDNPFGDHRADIRSGQITQMLYSIHAKKGEKRKLTDFLPFYRKRVQPDENVTTKARDLFANIAKAQGKK